MGAEADCVQDRIEDWSVVIDVHHRHPHTGYWAQTTLQKKQKENKVPQINLKIFFLQRSKNYCIYTTYLSDLGWLQ